MHCRTIRDHALATTVRVHTLADRGAIRLSDTLGRRIPDSDDERGSQTVEYAMLGGVSAAACGALATAVRDPDFIRRVIEAVLSVLMRTVKSWA
jgi:hypothetical protein